MSQSVRQSVSWSVYQSVPSYYESLGSLQGQSKRDMLWMKGHWTYLCCVLRISSVRFILQVLHTHIIFTYYCRCITLATDSIFKQFSQMHAHMTHSPTQHTHNWIQHLSHLQAPDIQTLLSQQVHFYTLSFSTHCKLLYQISSCPFK